MKKITAFLCGAVILISVSTVEARELSDAQICRAAISTIMNQDLKDVEFKREVKQVKYINIPPSKDNSVFKFKCTVSDKKIQWASEFGTWQDSDLDSFVTYKIKENILIMSERYNSGYTFNKKFSLNNLKDKK